MPAAYYIWHGIRYDRPMKPYLVSLLMLSLACAPTPFRPERPHPTAAQMQDLLNAPLLGAKAMKLPFEIQVYSRVAFPGSDVWVTCVVPERYGVGRIRYGIEDVATYEGTLDHTQNRLLVQNVPCGVLTATCAIQTVKGLQRAATVEIAVRGGMCEGGR